MAPIGRDDRKIELREINIYVYIYIRIYTRRWLKHAKFYISICHACIYDDGRRRTRSRYHTPLCAHTCETRDYTHQCVLYTIAQNQLIGSSIILDYVFTRYPRSAVEFLRYPPSPPERAGSLCALGQLVFAWKKLFRIS